MSDDGHAEGGDRVHAKPLAAQLQRRQRQRHVVLTALAVPKRRLDTEREVVPLSRPKGRHRVPRQGGRPAQVLLDAVVYVPDVEFW